MTLLAVLLLASDALACSCLSGLFEVRPVDGATAVPTDAAPLVIFTAAPGEVWLLDAVTGAEVPITVEPTDEGEGTVLRLVPHAALEPQHTYVIDGLSAYGLASFPATFTTGDGPDLEAPPAITLTGVDGGFYGNNDDCGDSLYLRPQVSGAPPDAFYEAEVAHREDFSDAATVRRSDAAHLELGWGLCSTTVTDLAQGDEVWVRARATDLSGNQGPWSDVVHLESISDSDRRATAGCGCASRSTGAAGSLLLALAAAGLALRGRGTAR
jgi:hypothetical protein